MQLYSPRHGINPVLTLFHGAFEQIATQIAVTNNLVKYTVIYVINKSQYNVCIITDTKTEDPHQDDPNKAALSVWILVLGGYILLLLLLLFIIACCLSGEDKYLALPCLKL